MVDEWDFVELADLMRSSSELRSSVSRAKTAAVVGKVVNLYISKADANTPIWKKWLRDHWGGHQPSVPVSEVRVNVTKE